MSKTEKGEHHDQRKLCPKVRETFELQRAWAMANWYPITMRHIIYLMLVVLTTFVATQVFLVDLMPYTVLETYKNVEQAQDEQATNKLLASHDLDMFVPLENASATFTLNDFQYFLLKDKLVEPSIHWRAPNNSDDTNDQIPVSMLMENKRGDGDGHICQIICRFGEQSFHYSHFPHFLQQALPCYNMFHFFSKTIQNVPSRRRPLRNYMVLPDRIKSLSGFTPYIREFLQAMEGHPYFVQMIYGFDKAIPVHEDCFDAPLNHQQSDSDEQDHRHLESSPSSSPSVSTSSAILASKMFADSGWDHPVRYFLSSDLIEPILQTSYENYELIQQIQQSVLGDHFNAGLSSFDYDDSYNETAVKLIRKEKKQLRPFKEMRYRIIQILILDRKSSSREFVNVDEVVNMLQNFTVNCSTTSTTITQFRLNVTYVSSFNKLSLHEQAYYMHHADIIYSPHGAQLANLIYIRPCTVVVEFFPRSYYLQFFQTMVVTAHGIPLEGYPSAAINYTDKIIDTLVTRENFSMQRQAKSINVNVTLDFFEMTLPQILDETIQCRIKYEKKENGRRTP